MIKKEMKKKRAPFIVLLSFYRQAIDFSSKRKKFYHVVLCCLRLFVCYALRPLGVEGMQGLGTLVSLFIAWDKRSD
jgi:hypothetical protein